MLLTAVRERLGGDAIVTGHRCVRIEQDDGVTVHFAAEDGTACEPVHGKLAIACDGLHSAVRRQLHPHEGPPH